MAEMRSTILRHLSSGRLPPPRHAALHPSSGRRGDHHLGSEGDHGLAGGAGARLFPLLPKEGWRAATGWFGRRGDTEAVMRTELDGRDRAIVNRLQHGFPICERPFAQAALELGLDEGELLQRLGRLLESGVLTRFGPMFQIERAGGAVVLAAMQVPDADLERVVTILNALPEVAHNYLREHRFNLWFVLATASLERMDRVIDGIEAATGYPVHAMPKLKEYFLDLRLPL